MRLRLAYDLRVHSAVREVVQLPLELTLSDLTLISLAEPARNSREPELTLVTAVDVSQLDVRDPEDPSMQSKLVAREVQYLHEVATDFVSALSFLTDLPIRFHTTGATLLPDNQDDESLLRSFEDCLVHDGVVRTTHPLIRTVDPGSLFEEHFKKLLAKREGLHLYREALLLETPVGQYRELWRLLESAFGCQKERLTHLLAKYPPAVEIGFTRDELRRLLAVRHRISHGTTKVGILELKAAYAEAASRLERLKCLAERVLVTKSSWGTPSLDFDELSPLANYFTADGTAIIRHTIGKLRL